MTETIHLGDVKFEAPRFADTVVSGWQIEEETIVTEGRYFSEPWTPRRLRSMRRAERAHERFLLTPEPVRRLILQAQRATQYPDEHEPSLIERVAMRLTRLMFHILDPHPPDEMSVLVSDNLIRTDRVAIRLSAGITGALVTNCVVIGRPDAHIKLMFHP